MKKTRSLPRLKYISPEKITMPASPLRGESDLSSLMSLVSSISRYGIISPITVRRAKRGRYAVVCGSRRFCAAQLAGLDRIPCVIVSSPPPAMSLAENLQRERLGFFEEASAFHDLARRGITPEKAEELLGVPQQYVTDSMRVLTLPKRLINRVQAKKISPRHALILSRLGEDDLDDVTEQVIRHGLDAAATEKYVDSILSRTDTKRPPPVPAVTDTRFFLNTVERGVDTMRRSGMDVGYEKTSGGDNLTLTITLPSGK